MQATQDAIIGSTAEPGIECWPLSGVWSSCNTYSVDSPTGGSTLYDDVLSTNANSFNAMTFVDALGRTRYTQWYNALNVTSPTADLTRRQETQYNVLGEPTAVIVTDLSPQPGQTITSVTTSATYNDLGQQLTLNDPDRGTHTTSYDADGRLIKDVSGSRTIGMSYDLLGRALCEQDAAPTTDGSGSCSSGSHPLVQNTYDTTKLGTAGSTDFSVGALTQSISTTYYPDGTSSATTSKIQHDQRGRAITGSLQITVPSSWSTTLPTYQETQNYNDANQPMTTHTTVGSSAGSTFSQGYDGTTGALLGVSNTTVGNTSLASQSYDLHGQITGLTFPSSTGTSLVSDHFTYDGDLRPSSTTAAWSASNTTFFTKSLTYDPVGNVISTLTSQPAVSGQSNSGGSEVEDFCYDAESRLIWAGNSGTVPNEGGGTSCGSATLANTLNGASYNSGYNYTQLGQLWQGPLNGTGANKQYLYCSSSQPHQLTGLYAAGTTCANRTNPSYSASYDSWGNETLRTYNGTTATLSYDKLDKLVQWNAGSTNQAWYAYDASGERTVARNITTSGTSLTVYAFGLEEHVYNGTGSNVSNTYYYSLGGRLIGKFDGTNTQYYLTDVQGSVLTTFSNAVTTTSVSGYQAYGPYGNKLASSGSMGTAKGYTGQYQEPMGLDYYNARYYDPVIGCFISADVKQGNAQGMDPYSYVNGNPETLTDPTGQVTHCHEPGDCGPGSYTTDVGGGDTGSGSVVVGQDGSPCTGLCDGPGPKPRNYYPQPQSVSGNPKIVTTTSCDSGCNSNKILIKSYYANKKAKIQATWDAIGDFLSLAGDVTVIIVDFLSKAWDDLAINIAIAIIHLGALIIDAVKATGGKVDQFWVNALGYFKLAIPVLNFARGFLSIINPADGILKTLKDFLVREVKHKVADSIGLFLSALGAPTISGYSQVEINNEYANINNTVDSYSTTDAHTQCQSLYAGQNVKCF